MEAAEWWSARRRLAIGGASDEEQFRQWLAAPENAAAWAEVEQLVDGIGRFAAMPGMVTMREAALSVRPVQVARGRLQAGRWLGRGLTLTAAAAAAVALVVTLPSIEPPREDPVAHASAVQRFATKVGEKRRLRLPDGSFVTLNTGSLVEVSYTPAKRDIRLLTGQAFFKVARNPGRPFVVAAGDRHITATGTAFDVRLDEKGAVSVMLVEGRVVVDPIRRSGSAAPSGNAVREILEPGERLIVPSIGAPKILAVDIERATSWHSGELIFRDEPLSDAIAELNRYTETKLVTNDPRVRALKVSGVFKTSGSENFVAALTSFYPVEAKQRSAGVIELEWR
jgi:transmembrane sensor